MPKTRKQGEPFPAPRTTPYESHPHVQEQAEKRARTSAAVQECVTQSQETLARQSEERRARQAATALATTAATTTTSSGDTSTDSSESSSSEQPQQQKRGKKALKPRYYYIYNGVVVKQGAATQIMDYALGQIVTLYKAGEFLPGNGEELVAYYLATPLRKSKNGRRKLAGLCVQHPWEGMLKQALYCYLITWFVGCVKTPRMPERPTVPYDVPAGYVAEPRQVEEAGFLDDVTWESQRQAALRRWPKYITYTSTKGKCLQSLRLFDASAEELAAMDIPAWVVKQADVPAQPPAHSDDSPPYFHTPVLPPRSLNSAGGSSSSSSSSSGGAGGPPGFSSPANTGRATANGGAASSTPAAPAASPVTPAGSAGAASPTAPSTPTTTTTGYSNTGGGSPVNPTNHSTQPAYHTESSPTPRYVRGNVPAGTVGGVVGRHHSTGSSGGGGGDMVTALADTHMSEAGQGTYMGSSAEGDTVMTDVGVGSGAGGVGTGFVAGAGHGGEAVAREPHGTHHNSSGRPGPYAPSPGSSTTTALAVGAVVSAHDGLGVSLAGHSTKRNSPHMRSANLSPVAVSATSTGSAHVCCCSCGGVVPSAPAQRPSAQAVATSPPGSSTATVGVSNSPHSSPSRGYTRVPIPTGCTEETLAAGSVMRANNDGCVDEGF